MPQPKKSYQELRVPFQKMSFSPDVPSAALGPNEYNEGLNVETDVRGLRSISGDVSILQTVPSKATFVTGGYRQPGTGFDSNNFYFIVACEDGHWYVNNGTGWQDVTPIGLSTTYTQDQNITEAWSGTVPIFNDDGTAPIFWPESSRSRISLRVTNLTFHALNTARVYFDTQATPPYQPGDYVVLYNMEPASLNGRYYVSACNTTYATITNRPSVPSVTQLGVVTLGAARMRQYSNQLPISIYKIGPVPLVSGRRKIEFGGIAEATGCSISGTTLTIGTMTMPSGSNRNALLATGMYVRGVGIATGTKVVRNINGQGDGSTWEVNISQTVAGPTTITCYPWTEKTGGSGPYLAGEYVTLSEVDPRYYDGTWLVESCDMDQLTVVCNVTDAHTTNTGTLSPEYSWNYNPNWSSVYAKWLRIYNTPNVGSILVAGNLVAVNQATGATENYPVTVQWSQAFGLNQVPTSWTPTTTNIANQLEVPLRGQSLDGFPCAGNFFVSSYWDTVIFSPLNYSTTNTPVLGVRLYNQGRGLLNPNCWANTDQKVYGIDARDIWVFDGNDFQGLGNQRVKNWFFDQIDPIYYSRIYMEVNTAKNQIEIFYPDSDAVDGVPNKMISYRFDLDCWNPPRDVNAATFSCESPKWYLLTDPPPVFGPVWRYDPASRCIVYARGQEANSSMLQKDEGYEFIIGNTDTAYAIGSYFRKDNIKLLEDYSGKLLTHRVLPEVVNLNDRGLEIKPDIEPGLIGSVNIQLEGANSVGQPAQQTAYITVNTDTDEPWAQIAQNAHRVNSLEVDNESDANIWMLTAITFQITQTEDDR